MSKERDHEFEVDDDALALAAGGLSLPNSPSNSGGGVINFNINSTINYTYHPHS